MLTINAKLTVENLTLTDAKVAQNMNINFDSVNVGKVFQLKAELQKMLILTVSSYVSYESDAKTSQIHNSKLRFKPSSFGCDQRLMIWF
jgi:hypothetical protein